MGLQVRALLGTPDINTSMGKRTLIHDMPWQEIQSLYDAGMSQRDLQGKFRIAFKTFQKAKRLGLFVPRDLSSAGKIRATVKPNDYSVVRGQRPELVNYRADCSFKFNVFDFPDEFDIGLVEQHGWYKAKNRGNNLTGVSRDHIVSVRYGFDNGISPELISHPANCQLLQHGMNVSKGKNCDLTIEELFVKISNWNDKYNKVSGDVS